MRWVLFVRMFLKASQHLTFNVSCVRTCPISSACFWRVCVNKQTNFREKNGNKSPPKNVFLYYEFKSYLKILQHMCKTKKGPVCCTSVSNSRSELLLLITTLLNWFVVDGIWSKHRRRRRFLIKNTTLKHHTSSSSRFYKLPDPQTWRPHSQTHTCKINK